MIDCPSCGYPNDETEYRCERCGRRFDAPPLQPLSALGLSPDAEDEEESDNATPRPDPPAMSTATTPPAIRSGSTSMAAGNRWRFEVSSRVERFRERRRAQGILPLDFGAQVEPATDSSACTVVQPARERLPKVIPFEEIARGCALAAQPTGLAGESSALPKAHPHPEVKPGPPPLQTQRSRVRASSSVQASLAFPEALLPIPVETVELPVAPLAARVLAGAANAALLACGYALFFGFYTFLGGKFPLQRAALAALAASLAFLAFTFTFLFLYFSETTPGMRWMGLRLVDFDGVPARRDQRVLRLLGLLASSAAMGVGFLWAAVDEQGLTWHDRISRTCLTMDDSVFRRR